MKSFYLLHLLLLSTLLHPGTVYFTPATFGTTNESDFYSQGRDGCNLAMTALRNEIIKKGHNCTFLTKNILNNLDKECWFFVMDVPRDPQIETVIKKHPKERSMLIIGEPPSVSTLSYEKNNHVFYKKAYTYFNELVDNSFYFLFYYPQPFLKVCDTMVPFSQKKLCTTVIGEHTSNHPDELYTARKSILSFFEKNYSYNFDFYGWGWNSLNHPCYRGPIANKLPFLCNYKFAICYENMKSTTYITEKIFDALHAGCVPIYWGAKEITSLIPFKAYILREDFNTDEELYNYLNTMTEAEYQQYLKAADEFFKSSYASKFSIDFFVNMMVAAIFD